MLPALLDRTPFAAGNVAVLYLTPPPQVSQCRAACAAPPSAARCRSADLTEGGQPAFGDVHGHVDYISAPEVRRLTVHKRLMGRFCSGT